MSLDFSPLGVDVLFKTSSDLTKDNRVFRENSLSLDNLTLNNSDNITTSTTSTSADFTTSTLQTYTTTLEKVLRQSISDILNFGEGITKLTTDNFLELNDSSKTDVTIRRPEVPDNYGIGTAEKVVIGAVVVVVSLTVIAIFLRLCMPIYRKLGEKKKTSDNLSIQSTDCKVLSGYSNVAIEISSQSSGNSTNDLSNSSGSHPSSDEFTGSNSSSDWSEASSNQTKSTTFSKDDSETNMADRLHRQPEHPGLLSSYRAASTTSLPLYIQNERLSKSAKSSPVPYRKSSNGHRKSHDEMLSVISTKSLEPVRMEDIYRSRWDDQWDPYGSIPRGNLSHHSHPSESRLSLNSFSSHNSSTTFPIPNRKAVQHMATNQERRYPSNLKAVPAQIARKEKHVRLTPPTDRKR